MFTSLNKILRRRIADKVEEITGINSAILDLMDDGDIEAEADSAVENLVTVKDIVPRDWHLCQAVRRCCSGQAEDPGSTGCGQASRSIVESTEAAECGHSGLPRHLRRLDIIQRPVQCGRHQEQGFVSSAEAPVPQGCHEA